MNFQLCYNIVFTLLCTRRAFSLRFKDGQYSICDLLFPNTAKLNSTKVEIDNRQMYDLGDKNDGNNHSFIHEDVTNMTLNTVFVIPQCHRCVDFI